MYNECDQNESCAAGRNSNSCSVQPRQPCHGIHDLTKSGRSKTTKLRTRHKSKRTCDPQQFRIQNKENNGCAPVSVLLSEPNDHLDSFEHKANVPHISPRKNVKHLADEGVSEQNGHTNYEHLKPPPDPSMRTSSNARKEDRFQSVRATNLENTSNSNSFGFFISTNDEGDSEKQPSCIPRIHSGLSPSTSYIHMRNPLKSPCNSYTREYIPQRRSVSVTEKKNPTVRTRYVTELKLNLHKGRAQKVGKNWPPRAIEHDSLSDEHGEQTDQEDVQVKAILCRASSSTENPERITTGCVSKIGRDVIQIVTPKVSTKGIDLDLEVNNGAEPTEIVGIYQRALNDGGSQMEMGLENKHSAILPSQLGAFMCPADSKRTSDTRASSPDEQRLGASSTQTAAQTSISPGSFSVSSFRQGLPTSHSETQASPTMMKKDTERPNCAKRSSFNKPVRDEDPNNVHSILNEPSRESCYDEPSVTSGCTLIRSSVAEEPSARTLAECISAATVISPAAGKTSRGTQSERIEQVKVVRDMEIQTGLTEIPEELSQDVTVNEGGSNKQLVVSRTKSPFPANRGMTVGSRLPVPINSFIRAEWIQATRDSSDSILKDKQPIERDPFVSPSPSSYLILPPAQTFPENYNSPSLAPSACDSGHCCRNTMNQIHGVVASPEQITPTRKSLYQLMRQTITSISNNTQKPTVPPSKLSHITTSIPMFEGKSSLCQLEESLIKSEHQDKNWNKRCYSIVYHGDSPTNSRRTPDGPLESLDNRQPSAVQKTEAWSPSRGNRDVVFVERSSSQNSSQDSIMERINARQFYPALGRHTSERTMTNRIQTMAGRLCMKVSGDQTTETCGCCPDGTCDCPSSTTITGSRACTCEYCHGSGRGASEELFRKAHLNNPRLLLQTSGDEGSFHDYAKQDQRLGHVCDIVCEPSCEAETAKLRKNKICQNTSQCSCCSESTLTELVPTTKTGLEWRRQEPTGLVMTSENTPGNLRNPSGNGEVCTYSTPWGSQMPDSCSKKAPGLDRNTIRRPGFVLLPPSGENNIANRPIESASGTSRIQQEDMRTEGEKQKPTNYVPTITNKLQSQTKPTEAKPISKRSTEFVSDKLGEKHINNDAVKVNSASPYIDTLLNLVGQKEKRSILQRWLLEQVAFSAKQNQTSGFENRPQESAEALRTDVGRVETASGSSKNESETDSCCSCSACQEAAESRIQAEDPDSSDGSHGDYSRSSDSSTIDREANRKPIRPIRGRSQIPVKCNETEYDINSVRPKLNSRRQTGRESIEPQVGHMQGSVHHTRPIRSNSEGSLEQVETRLDYDTPRRQMCRVPRWGPNKPHRSMSPSLPVPPNLTTTLARNAQDRLLDRNSWNSNLQQRFRSPSRSEMREMTNRGQVPSVGCRSGGQALHSAGPAKSYKLMSLGRTASVIRDIPDGGRTTNQLSSGTSRSRDLPMEGRNTRLKQLATHGSGLVPPIKTSERIGNQNRFGSLKLSRLRSGAQENEFEVERVFELSQYDDLVKSHLNAADRRIKAVALKNGCQIRITGPIIKPESSINGISSRGKTMYNCHIYGPSEDRIGKCVNFLKETFPNSFLRTAWRA